MKPAPLLLLALLGLAGCRSPESPPPTPYVLVLGNAQDAGFPQIGAGHRRARAAWANAALRRSTASLLVADPASGRRWLLDATPDLPEQVERARGHPPTRRPAPGRAPLFDGIFLTHAHMGHYAGLLHLGREAHASERQPVWGSPRMLDFLRTNAPWELLVRLEHVALHALEPERPVALGRELSLTPLVVPHRAEYTDTLAFVVRGPRRSLLYLPDIDKWERWDRRIEDVLRTVDVALLDGTFFADGEIPGRSMAEIPHPFIEESMARFAALPARERAKIRFIHLNHTNPAIDPDSPARRRIEGAGYGVAEPDEIHAL